MDEAALAREVAASLPYYPYKKLERFYDISGILAKPQLFDAMCALIAERARASGITKIVAFEARGFLFTPVAIKLGVPFIMLRKSGKMPNTVSSAPYTKEYEGVDVMCIQRDAVGPGDKVLLVDDILATGGTMCAGIELVKALGAEPTECACMVELKCLNGAARCTGAGAQAVWGFIGEDVLNVQARLPEGYVDDGQAH